MNWRQWRDSASEIKPGMKLFTKSGRKYYLVQQVVERGVVAELWCDYGYNKGFEKAAGHTGIKEWGWLALDCLPLAKKEKP